MNASQMKCCDAYTINQIKLPSMVLMERAALSVVEEIEKSFEEASMEFFGETALVLAGRGNNGADAFAVARMLAEKGVDVTVFLLEPEKRRTDENKLQLEILSSYAVTFVTELEKKEYTILVDGLLGIGGRRELNEQIREVIETVNEMPGLHIAVDMPTGVDTDTGLATIAFQAHKTVTFGFWKPGQLFFPGAQYCGEVIVKDIGFPVQAMYAAKPQTVLLDTFDFVREGLQRKPDANKGSLGKILFIAGSSQYPGAALLTGRAALRSGSGMVKVLVPKELKLFLVQNQPELLVDDYEAFETSVEWCDAIAIGPGLSKAECAKKLVRKVLFQTNKPLLLDADAINIVCEESEDMEQLIASNKNGRDCVVTPHMGEFRRLFESAFQKEVSIPECKEHILEYAKELAVKLCATVVAKDARTVIAHRDRPNAVNRQGNSGMAVAGSGDVLSGIIASYMPRAKSCYEAACLGVALHARSGDFAKDVWGEDGLLPSDMIQNIWR